MKEVSMSSITWLHLSDLHYERDPLLNPFWGNIADLLLEDLRQVCEESGPPDVIFFTGDLVRSGCQKNFTKLNSTIRFIYNFLNEQLQANPILLCVPGNHDLERPPNESKSTAEVILLKEWSNFPQVQNTFWRDQENSYLKVVKDAFQNYTDWFEGYSRIQHSQLTRGYLPGDFATTIKKDGIELGIVGFNTAFLQLTSGNYEGKLAVHPVQLASVCGEYPSDWVAKHDLCILLTHHPPEWFNPMARRYFHGEISFGGRFALHLFGHMHEPYSETSIKYGNEVHRIFQAPSLFGLKDWEKDKNTMVERDHGYTVGRLEFDQQQNSCKLCYWPRKAFLRSQAGWSIGRDPSFTYRIGEENIAETIELKRAVYVTTPRIVQQSPIKKEEIRSAFKGLLESPVFFDNPDDLQESDRKDLAKVMKKRISHLQQDSSNTLSNFQVVVVGNACTDVFVKTDALLTPYFLEKGGQISYPLGSKILIDELVFHTGGGGANASATFGRLGLKVAFIGRIGADMRGHRLFQWFKNNNIIFLGQVAPECTSFSVVLRSSLQEHTSLTYIGSNTNLSFDEFPQLDSGDYWLYGASMVGRSLETQRKVFASAKQKPNNIKTAYSPSSYICRIGLKNLITILENTDVLIVNKESAENLVGQGESIDLAESLTRYGPNIVTVSQNVQGVHVYVKDSEERLHIKPASQLNIQDTCGAGDAFGSGFIAGLIMDKDVKQAALLGILNAEHVIKEVGANKGIPNRDTAEKMLKEPGQYEKHGLSG